MQVIRRGTATSWNKLVSSETTYPRIAIGIATRGRPDVLREAVADIWRQTRLPDRVLISCTGPEDVEDLTEDCRIEILHAEIGLPRQRNAILDSVKNCDILLFIDDDFLMEPHYVEAVETGFRLEPSIVAATGQPIADGTRGPGYSVEQARMMIDAATAGDLAHWERVAHGYGCNMAIRLSVAREHDVRFDERLPLYAWSEDVDYTHRIAKFGQIAKLHAARGVHLGVKHGRTPGGKLGYSQVANPIYLYQKGSYSLGRAARSVGRNLTMNTARAMWSEPYVDRRGRLVGNLRAFADLVRGRMMPERILDL